MKMAPAAAPAPQKRGGWRALPVLALVLLSMLVPLLFVLNQSGYLEDDRGPGARFETYELDEHRNGNQSQQAEEGDKGKHVAELIKQLEPNFQKDVVETLAKEAESGTGNIVSLASDPKNSSSNIKSKAVSPLESTSTISSSSTTEKVLHPSGTTEHVNGASSDETEKSCQLEFGSYCIWRDEHREQMKDSMVKKLKDQLFVARAYYPSIAKIPAQDKLTRQMKMNIQEYERMLNDATTDADLPPDVEKKIQRMEYVIAKAKVFPVECSNVDKKLRQLLDLTEDEAHFHMKQSAFLYQLAVQTMPKSLHCLSMRLTVEYFRLHSADPELFQERDKHEEPSFHHYVIFSKHILAASVVINSTVMLSKETDNLVFHVITDSQNYVAMKYWFYRSNYKNATVDVLNFEDHKKTFDLSDKLQHFLPGEYTVSIRGRTDYISLYGSAHFLLPDMLPKLKRVIVLDDDVVVQRDLSSLWDLDMKGKVNGALEYCGLRLGQLKSHLGQNSFDSNACVWMSGLNVIDLEKWREHKLTESFLRFLDVVPSGSNKSDSTRLFRANLLTFEGLTYPLDSSWALSGLGHNYGIDPETIKKASVLHYSGVMKPWLEIGIHDYKRYWRRFLKRDDQIMDDCNVNP